MCFTCMYVTSLTAPYSYMFPSCPFLFGAEYSAEYPLQKSSPVLGPMWPHFFILHAEIRWALQVNQLCLFDWPDINILWHKVFACAHGPVNNLGGRQIFGFEVQCNVSQLLKAFPTGLDRAWPRNSMALTFHFKRGFQDLQKGMQELGNALLLQPNIPQAC